MKKTRNAALACITHGNRLLLFREPDFPEAGIQVPGGTQQENETPEQAVMREAVEETGLTNLRLNAYLAEYEHDFVEDVLYRCRCFHIICEGQPPERWQHYEVDPADGSKEPILFELFWARLPDEVPPLSGHLTGHEDEILPALIEWVEKDHAR